MVLNILLLYLFKRRENMQELLIQYTRPPSQGRGRTSTGKEVKAAQSDTDIWLIRTNFRSIRMDSFLHATLCNCSAINNKMKVEHTQFILIQIIPRILKKYITQIYDKYRFPSCHLHAVLCVFKSL